VEGLAIDTDLFGGVEQVLGVDDVSASLEGIAERSIATTTRCSAN